MSTQKKINQQPNTSSQEFKQESNVDLNNKKSSSKSKTLSEQPSKSKTSPEVECKEQPSKINLLLADSIFVFHCIIILFVLFAPFTNIPALLILHITFAICLMVHWHANSNICSLSVIEAHLRGLDAREDTFTHQFIAPVYDISSTEWSNIVWIITSIVLVISIYKLYNTDKFKIAWQCYLEAKEEPNLYKKLLQFLQCFKPLFIID
jgi:hypothetical protein